MRWRTSVGLMLVCFLAGCPSPGTHDPGYVAKEWSNTMREFGIVPVYPPREDVAVGDIYLSPLPPDEQLERQVMSYTPGQFLPIPVLVASMDVRQELDAYYGARLSFPQTPGGRTDKPGIIDQPHGEESIFTGGDNKRLRLGGFPEFFSVQISRGGVEGLVPTEAVNIAAGAFASSNKQVRVSVPMVESYGLPASVIIQDLGIKPDQEYETSLEINSVGGGTQKLDGKGLAKLFTNQKYKPKEKDVAGYLRVITEVYATRAIDISVEAQRGGSGGVNVQPTAALLQKLVPATNAKPNPTNATPGGAAGGTGWSGACGRRASTPPAAPAAASPAPAEGATPETPTPPAAPTPPTEPPNPTPAPTPTPPATFDKPTPQEVAASLNDQLNKSLQTALPGVSVKFLSVSAFGVSMRRTYERPVAIGYRAVILAVMNDGRIKVAGVSSSAVGVNTMASAQPLEQSLSTDLTNLLKQSFGASASAHVTVAMQTTPPRLNAILHGIPTGKEADAKTRATQFLAQAIQAHQDVLHGATVGGVDVKP